MTKSTDLTEASRVAAPTDTSEMEKLQADSQAFQLAMAGIQAQDAKSKSGIALMEALAASDRSNSDRVAQYIGK